MSKNPEPKNTNNEEVDLLQLFSFFENKIKSLFNPFFNFFASILNLLVLLIQYVFKNYIKISVVVLVAFVLGFVYDSQQPELYSSKMTVKPFFKSQYQLINNINYYNELAINEDYNKLAEIFNIDIEEAQSLLSFAYETNISNENEKVKLYNKYIKKLDTASVSVLDYQVFAENITDYDAELFDIKVYSLQNDIFYDLSVGFKNTFESDVYSNIYKEKKEILYSFKKKAIEKSLSDIDSLRNVYVEVLNKDNSQNIEMLGMSAVRLSDDQQKTREFDLLKLQIDEQSKLDSVEKEALEETVLFEVISDFQFVGSVVKNTLYQKKFLFPVIAFILVIVFFFFKEFKRFILTYKEQK